MTPDQFKAWIMKNDPELADAYEGQNWWHTNKRPELVGAYFNNPKRKTESLQHVINRYKDMLRSENRPKIISLRDVPLSEKVQFCKMKLNCL
jgi:hypothetical protein